MVDAAMPNVPVCEALLATVAPHLDPVIMHEYATNMAAAAWLHGIESPKALAAWVAQMAHESGGFRFLVEIWGPTPQQRRYGRGTLAKRLGNEREADGYAYRGRGWIQLTGKNNYRLYGEQLGIDLVNDPDLAADPAIAFSIAAAYWSNNNLSEIAETQSVKAVTKIINGGYNGLSSRTAYYKKAMSALKEKEYV